MSAIRSIHPDVFVNAGLVSPEEIQPVIREHITAGESIAYLLVKNKLISEDMYFELLNTRCDIWPCYLSRFRRVLIPNTIIKQIPLEVTLDFKVVPFDIKDNVLQVAMVDPLNRQARTSIEKNATLPIKVWVASLEDIGNTITNVYAQDRDDVEVYRLTPDQREYLQEIGIEDSTNIFTDETQACIPGLDQGVDEKEEAPAGQIDSMSKTAVESSITREALGSIDSAAGRLLRMIIGKARELNASDIHIDPREGEVQVRFRIDGALYEIFTIGLEHKEELINKIKVMSKMTVYEHRLPQDGKILHSSEAELIELRVATLPVDLGEKITLRVLRKGNIGLSLEDAGFEDEDYEKYTRLLAHTNGILLVVGPTGSGKTSTLYLSLEKIQSKDKHIVTLEDPIEYRIDGVNQSQINPEIGYTFARALRTVLRIDPDVIMIGEIRDPETAEIAVRAALTGRLVFSTMHTSDTIQAYTRLLDMGVPSYLLVPTVVGIVAQRLVRKLCPDCKKPSVPAPALLKRMNTAYDPATMTFFDKAGCERCRDTGYTGRTGVFEVLVPNQELDRLILAYQDAKEIRARAIGHGLSTLGINIFKKAMRGETSLNELDLLH